MKFLKKGFRTILEKPSRLFNPNERTIKFHFDIMHGKNNLEKAIDILRKTGIAKARKKSGRSAKLESQKWKL